MINPSILTKKETALPILKKCLGEQIKLTRINVLKHKESNLVIEYKVLDKSKKKEYIGKVRFDGKINTARGQYLNLKKINQFTQNRLHIPKELYYLNQYKLFIYKKIIGEPLADAIATKKSISTKQLEMIVDWLIKVEKIKIKKKTILNTKFKPKYIVKQTLKNARQLPKHEKKIIDVTKKLNNLIKKHSIGYKVLCHNDLQPQNIMFNKGQLALIDFDNSIIDDPMIDFTNLLTQIRFGGMISNTNLVKYQKHLIKYYYKKTKLRHNFETRLKIFLAYASLKNLNLHLTNKHTHKALVRLKIIKDLLKDLHEK